eukprot:Ihof_evm2s692 gene=Ihof_evmTU2s692
MSPIIPQTNGVTNTYTGVVNGNHGLTCGNGVIKRSEPISAVAMGVYCFDVLKQYLFRTPPVPVPEFTNEKFPLFVTWTVPSCHGNENGRELRGCIGTFRAVHLGQGLHDYVLNSAFKDHRFPPITKEEFGLLECEVSLLTKFEIAANYHDWTIGQHGIWISFTDQKGVKYTSTYLPQVMSER